MTFNPKDIRKDFPTLNKKLIYFDNASTTQKPIQVINSLKEFYEKYNANVHRGAYSIAEKATYKYEKSRTIVSQFINANNDEIVFTKNTTESINIISNSMSQKLIADDEIIITEMEHHSNIIPWLMLAKKCNVKIKYIPLLKSGKLDIDQLPSLITPKTKLISITHMSNVIGVINPIEKIIKIAHENEVKVLVDAAQSISHQKIDVKKINCDFLVFSGHKILAPSGIGILYSKKKILEELIPLMGGGQMIKEVTLNNFTYNSIPWKFEAGTPNIAGAIGLGEAINYLNTFDLKELHSYTKDLCDYLINKLKTIQGITLYPSNLDTIGPVISFSLKNIHGYDLTKLLDTYGICIRSGHHCAQPILNKYKVNSLNRISLYFYNTKDEIDFFYEKLNKVIKILS